jgi:signal transduction histidine kinase/ligand-binding sensor domain-containing protein
MNGRKTNSFSVRLGVCTRKALRLAQISARFLLICMLAATVASGSTLDLNQLDHAAWTGRDGAPMAIDAIAQTANGLLWLGSSNGLYQFDGSHFVAFSSKNNEPELPSAVSTLYVSPDDAVWVGFWIPGIALIRNGHVRIFAARDGVEGSVNQILGGPGGTLWAVAHGQLIRYDGDKWVHDPIAAKLSAGDNITRAFFDIAGTQWITAGDSLYSRASTTQAFDRKGDASEAANRFGQSADGRVWISKVSTGANTPNRFQMIAPTSQASSSAHTPRVEFSEFLADREGAFWFLTSKGVVRAREREQTKFLDSHNDNHDWQNLEHLSNSDGLSSDECTAIFQDKAGTVWIGTARGLDRFSVPKLVKFIAEKLVGVAYVSPGRNGEIWIASGESPLISADTSLIETHGKSREITALHSDRTDAEWFTDALHLWRFSNGAFSSIPFPEPIRPYSAHQIAGDGRKDLYVLIIRKGVWRFSNDRWNTVSASGLPESMATTIFVDANGKLWVGYIDGEVRMLDDGAGRSYVTGEVGVGPIEVLSQNRWGLFAGGAEGVAVLHAGHFVPLSFSNRSLVRGTSGIVESGNGDLWLNGSHGVIHVAAAEIEAALRSPTHLILSERVFLDGGPLTAAEETIGIPTAAASTNGQLWFSNGGTVYSLDPDSHLFKEAPPPIEISSVVSDGAAQQTEKGISFMRAHSLRVGYFGIELASPERVRYRYKLDGYDNNWQDAGEGREAAYTSLGPGRYIFHAAATVDGQRWSESSPLSIKVLPAFYQTAWFRALALAFIVGLLWTLYAMRVRYLAHQIQERSEARANERVRIARDLHDTLLQGVHGLMLRFHYAAESFPEDHQSRILTSSALTIADRVIAEGRDKVSGLRGDTTTCQDLEEELSFVATELNWLSKVDFSIQTVGGAFSLDPLVLDELCAIAKEAVRNAFLHADATKITVELLYGAGEFCWICRDNGKGLDLDTFKRGGRAGHWGLLGMRERAEKVGLTLRFHSESGSGTEVVMTTSRKRRYSNLVSTRVTFKELVK